MEFGGFSEAPDMAVISLRRITLDGAAVLYVAHDADDGAWQFLDGDSLQISDAVLVSLGSLLKTDPALAQMADLPHGWCAHRASATEPWIREPCNGT